MCDKKQPCNCIAEILSVILLLQKNSSKDKKCLDTCDKGFLGNDVVCPKYNTRPVMLYTAFGNGKPWEMPVSKSDDSCDDSTTECSSVFRIEKLDDCCATFRVLKPCPRSSEEHSKTWKATDSFFTMDLSCVCAIKCLKDTVVDL
ncbi:MAG: spore coat protein Z [Mollicutes bacterium]|nr:spore coat protein Z [Mollicutes bacterium]